MTKFLALLQSAERHSSCLGVAQNLVQKAETATLCLLDDAGFALPSSCQKVLKLVAVIILGKLSGGLRNE